MRQKVRAFLTRYLFVIDIFGHLYQLQGDGRSESVRRKRRVSRARREFVRRDQFFFGPNSGQRIETVGQRLAEDDNVGLDVEVFDRPELAGAVKTHLDLVIDHQDVAFIENLF